MFNFKTVFVLVLVSLTLSFAGNKKSLYSAEHDTLEVLGKEMVLQKEPVMMRGMNFTLFTYDFMFFTAIAEDSNKEYNCLIAVKDDNLSKHFLEIFGHLKKGQKVFMKGNLFHYDKYLLVSEIKTENKQFPLKK